MPLYKLSPADLSDPNWQASSHRAAAIVRATMKALPAPLLPRPLM